jgi:hypothetical protein
MRSISAARALARVETMIRTFAGNSLSREMISLGILSSKGHIAISQTLEARKVIGRCPVPAVDPTNPKRSQGDPSPAAILFCGRKDKKYRSPRTKKDFANLIRSLGKVRRELFLESSVVITNLIRGDFTNACQLMANDVK